MAGRAQGRCGALGCIRTRAAELPPVRVLHTKAVTFPVSAGRSMRFQRLHSFGRHPEPGFPGAGRSVWAALVAVLKGLPAVARILCVGLFGDRKPGTG